jgi:hypothetical protein
MDQTTDYQLTFKIFSDYFAYVFENKPETDTKTGRAKKYAGNVDE